MTFSGPGAQSLGDNDDRARHHPVDTPSPGAGKDVPATSEAADFGEVAADSLPPVQRLEDIYSFAYTAGYRLAIPEDPSIEALVEVRRHLGSYLLEPERQTFEQLGETTGQWWAAFRRGWGDRRKGNKPDPHYRGPPEGE